MFSTLVLVWVLLCVVGLLAATVDSIGRLIVAILQWLGTFVCLFALFVWVAS